MSDFYDYDGNEISLEEWSLLFEMRHSPDAHGWEVRWRVGLDQIGDTRISTIWIGLDMRMLGDGPPLIFETLVERNDDEIDTRRYSTKEQAQHGHQAAVNQAHSSAGAGHGPNQ